MTEQLALTDSLSNYRRAVPPLTAPVCPPSRTHAPRQGDQEVAELWLVVGIALACAEVEQAEERAGGLLDRRPEADQSPAS